MVSSNQVLMDGAKYRAILKNNNNNLEAEKT